MAVNEKTKEVFEPPPRAAYSRAIPLVAATLSFIYHLLLAILSTYVPPDPYGAALALWIYSWSASIVCYFGIIAIVSRQSLLATTFAYLLFLDSVFSALWRFALLEYIVSNNYHDACGRVDKIHDGCGTRFNLVHTSIAAFFFILSFSEVLLAESVRRFARDLRTFVPGELPLPVTQVYDTFHQKG